VVELGILVTGFIAFIKYVIDLEARSSKMLLVRSLISEILLLLLFGVPSSEDFIDDINPLIDFLFNQMIIDVITLSIGGFIIFLVLNTGSILYNAWLNDNYEQMKTKKRIIRLSLGIGLLFHLLWFFNIWHTALVS